MGSKNNMPHVFTCQHDRDKERWGKLANTTNGLGKEGQAGRQAAQLYAWIAKSQPNKSHMATPRWTPTPWIE